MKSMRFLLVLSLLVSPAPSQTTKPDSQIQQQMLEELRAIHRDLRLSTTLQLLLAELQITQTSVDRATQRRDSLKAQVTQLQVDRTSAQANVARFRNEMDKVAKPEQEFVDQLIFLKDGLRKVTMQEAAASEQLQVTESRLRTAQAERDDVQGQVSELVKKLGADR